MALATEDALVMGCDSLGSFTRNLIDPFDLVGDFFDPANDFKPKTDPSGNPLLCDFWNLYSKAQSALFDHVTHVEKLFPLDLLEMDVMITGITSIADRTIKSLINEFKSSDKAFTTTPRSSN